MAEKVKKTKATAKPHKTAAKQDKVADRAKVKKVTSSTAKETGKLAKATPKPHKAAAKKIKVAEIAEPAKLAPPSREQIEQLARRYWAERGYQDGYAEQDWLRAEQALQQQAF